MSAEPVHMFNREFQAEASRQKLIRDEANKQTDYRMRDVVNYDIGLCLDTLMSKQNLETLAELAKGKNELAIGRLFMTVLEAEILNEELDKAEREL